MRRRIAVKALCVRLSDSRDKDSWLTLNQEYQVLSVLMTPRGPAKFRVVADDGRTPILADSTLFAMSSQKLPQSWVFAVREGGVVALGPPQWLETGFWERYFDGDADAVRKFQEEMSRMAST
jgi:hypothetical protein